VTFANREDCVSFRPPPPSPTPTPSSRTPPPPPPPPKDDSKRVVTFANREDYVSFRHHTYAAPAGPKSVELKEVGGGGEGVGG
jgi:hypothetical protein